MKKSIKLLILVGLMLMFFSTFLFSIEIEEITSISNPNLVLDYNLYLGAITGFENRVFVHNQYAIEEFIISEDGLLERIAMFETNRTDSAVINFTIDENKLYVFFHDSESDEMIYFLRVFDLSVQPMVEIPIGNIHYQFPHLAVVNFKYINEYILASYFEHTEDHQYVYNTLKICKNSYIVLDIIEELFDLRTRNDGNIFANFIEQGGYFDIRFDVLIDFEYEFISELSLPVGVYPRRTGTYFSGSSFIVTYTLRSFQVGYLLS